VKPSVIIISGVAALLLVGLFFTAIGVSLPQTRQVNNAEGSTLDITSEQGAPLALLVLGVPGLIVGLAIPLYITLWYLNREVKKAELMPNQPMELLQIGGGGASEQNVPITTLLLNNALAIVVGLGVVMVGIVVVILLATAL